MSFNLRKNLFLLYQNTFLSETAGNKCKSIKKAITGSKQIDWVKDSMMQNANVCIWNQREQKSREWNKNLDRN